MHGSGCVDVGDCGDDGRIELCREVVAVMVAAVSDSVTTEDCPANKTSPLLYGHWRQFFISVLSR